MPPGQAKKWRKGQPLPQGVAYYELPHDLVYRMPPPPPRHRYVRVGSDILLLSIGSGIVVDAMTMMHAEETTGVVAVPMQHFTVRHRIAGFRRYAG